MGASGGVTGRTAVDERLREILLDTSRREVPLAALVFTGLIVLFDLLMFASGQSLPWDYLLSDVVQIAAYLAVAVLVGRRLVPPPWSPWLWVCAVVISVSALSFQYTFDPEGAGIGILVMGVSVYGALTLFWAPFLASLPVVIAACAYTLFTHQPDYATAWLITLITCLGVSGALLYGRRRSARALAVASITIEDIATRDPLTGLLNRYGLDEAGRVLVGLADRADRPMFAMFVDVGGLKGVNDAHGHSVGDLVLQRTAAAAEAASRSGDLVVRWGGDEFLIIGIGDRPQAAELEARIRDGVDLSGLDGQWSGVLHIGTSAERGIELADLIAAADQSMYRRRRSAEG